jgi:hypothetical protein
MNRNVLLFLVFGLVASGAPGHAEDHRGSVPGLAREAEVAGAQDGSARQSPSVSPPANHSRPPATTSESGGIALIDVGDVSGSMKKYVTQMRAAEAGQLERLQPADLYVRIDFDEGPARIRTLSVIREAGDVHRLLELDTTPPKGQRTEISRGLSKSREIVLGHAGGRRVIQLLLTDGDLDPRDSLDAERRRLAEVAAWWKERENAVTILVAPDETIRSSPGFRDLAGQLGARTALLSDLATGPVLTRTVEEMRARIEAQPGPDNAEPAAPRLLYLLGVFVAAVSTVLVLHRRRRGGSRIEPAGHAEEDVLPARVAKAVIRTTSGGSTRETVVDLRPDLDVPPVTIGAPGSGATVELAGYSGTPISITADGARGEVVVPAGVKATVGADPAGDLGGRFAFFQKTSIKTRGAHILIALILEDSK